jgi:enoyl-CoA hydratase
MTDYTTIRYEQLDHRQIARITLDRPERRNAQNRRLLAELSHAFNSVALDDGVKVIILAGTDPHFSSGHDLGDYQEWLGNQSDTSGGFPLGPQWLSSGFERSGNEGYLAFEEEMYFRLCRRWHDLAKPTIAQVQGKVIAGGLMLMWVCDLIVASDDAEFSDLTLELGVNGVEWFAHPWELGARRAKEMLFTGDPVTAADAYRLGMVNRVVPRDQLPDATVELARRIATKPAFSLRLAKMAVNQTLDAQGFWTAQQAAFNLHHFAHADMRGRGLMSGHRAQHHTTGTQGED